MYVEMWCGVLRYCVQIIHIYMNWDACDFRKVNSMLSCRCPHVCGPIKIMQMSDPKYAYLVKLK